MKKILIGLSVFLMSAVVCGAAKNKTPAANPAQTGARLSQSSSSDQKGFTPHVVTGADNEHIVYLDSAHALKIRVTQKGTYLTTDNEQLNVNDFVKDAKTVRLTPAAPSVTEVVDLPPIHALTIQGPFIFHVTTGVKDERILLSGIDHPSSTLKVDIHSDGASLASDQEKLRMDAFVKDLHSLKLVNLKEATVRANVPTSISLQASNISSLQVNGSIAMPLFELDGKTNAQVAGNINIQEMRSHSSGKIHIQDLANDHFQLTHTGSGDVTVEADVTNLKINHSGSGHIEINPLHNYSFSLMDSGSRGSSVSLVGHTHRLNANLKDHAILEAYDFPADLSYITTADNAVAHINPLMRLFAASSGLSKIDYSHEPDHRFIYSSAFSHILHIANL